MDSKDFKIRAARLGEVDQVIGKLDPAIRVEAFSLLKAYVTGGIERPGGDPTSQGNGPGTREKSPTRRTSARSATKQASRKPIAPAAPGEGEDVLLEEHLSDLDHENAMLALAIFFKRHGRGPFDMAHVKAIGEQFSLNMPKRLDKFFETAKRGEPKVLIARKQADGWMIMPGGAKWLKETYGVSLGRAVLPAGDE